MRSLNTVSLHSTGNLIYLSLLHLELDPDVSLDRERNNCVSSRSLNVDILVTLSDPISDRP